MPLLSLLCRFVSILQPKRSCRPERLVFVSVHNGKISRVSQSLLELNSHARCSIRTQREDTKVFSASHFTHLPDELKGQADL